MANEAKSDKVVELTELGMSISITSQNTNWYGKYMSDPPHVQEHLFKMLLSGQVTNPAKREAITQMAMARGWLRVLTTQAAEKAEEKVEVPF